MSARQDILGRLRGALANGVPFPDAVNVPAHAHPVTQIADNEDLAARFTIEVERVKGVVHHAEDLTHARQVLAQVLRDNNVKRVTAWDDASLPIDQVRGLLAELTIHEVANDNASVATADAGITGCDWAIAATGTVALGTGPGRSRMASLLPPLHIALVTTDQLVPRLEDWLNGRIADGLREFRSSSNITLITGCSRTADIEMTPVFGVHGPLAFHVVLINASA
jgi:L-lactate dehydrogenase complex protein LldG